MFDDVLRRLDVAQALPVGEPAPLRIVVQVELERAHAVVDQLLRERKVVVVPGRRVELRGQRRGDALDERVDRRVRPPAVAVVAADDLQLVDLQAVDLRLRGAGRVGGRRRSRIAAARGSRHQHRQPKETSHRAPIMPACLSAKKPRCYGFAVSLEAPPENEPAPQPRRPLMQVLREAPATAAILAACVVVFLLAERAGSTKEIATLLRFGAVWREAVGTGSTGASPRRCFCTSA